MSLARDGVHGGAVVLLTQIAVADGLVQHWSEGKSAIVPVGADRWLYLERMPGACDYLGCRDELVDLWDPLHSNWVCYDTAHGITLMPGEKHILLRRSTASIKNVGTEIALCTDAGDDVFDDPNARDFTEQYQDVVV